MKAALLYEDERVLHIENIDDPVPGTGEALVKVAATGLCRTDLKLIHGFLRPRSYPHILGHEIAGEVVDSKPASTSDIEILQEIGNRERNVLVYPDVGCGHCSFCLAGRMNLCESLRRPGFEFDGGFAEFVKVPIRNLVRSAMGPEAAVLTDAGASALHALRRVNLQPGMRVVIAGVGGLGTMIVQLAKLFGCEVVALDIDDDKLVYARQLGADVGINLNGIGLPEVKAKLISSTGGKLANVFVDLVGNGSNQELALSLLGHDGKLLQMGYSEATLSGVPLRDIVYHEIQIVGSLACSIHDLIDIVDLVGRGQVKLNVTKSYNLEQINTAIEDLEHNRFRGRSIVIP